MQFQMNCYGLYLRCVCVYIYLKKKSNAVFNSWFVFQIEKKNPTTTSYVNFQYAENYSIP